MQIKIFESTSFSALEKEINAWLDEENYLDILDVKYTMSIDPTTHRRWSQALVEYEAIPNDDIEDEENE